MGLGDERKEHICITEDRLKVVLNEVWKEQYKEVKNFCNENNEHHLVKHLNENKHITEEEQTLIYDAKNFITNSEKKTSAIKWYLSLPICGLIIERAINYIIHKP